MATERSRPKQAQMVAWYAPLKLISTGVDVLVSELMGTRSDYRVIESLGRPQDIFDYSGEPEIWIDYVADLGDGWDSTYTIASLLASEHLDLASPRENASFRTARGRILIMGGDEVYPAASRDGYEERTVAPFQCALEESSEPNPNLFVIPGNHDWYDGLVSFSRLFCQERPIGGWKTRQRNSYFAIKLPYGWWLWAVDIQLESDVDAPQLEYFRRVAQQMQPGDRVILNTAEPHWIYGNIYDEKYQNNLAFLEKKIIREEAKASLRVALAGDLHHYRRHESKDGSRTQLITSGGGGAFLHPTYGSPVQSIKMGHSPTVEYGLRAAFPDEKTSKRLLLRDLIFPLYNPSFGVLTGLLYMLIAWVLEPSVEKEFAVLAPSAGFWTRAGAVLNGVLHSASGSAWIALIILGFVFFTDTHKKVYKYVGGVLHALGHLIGVVALAWLIKAVVIARLGLGSETLGETVVQRGGMFVGGYIVGSLLMGIYLYVSLRFFRRHANEAFSALHISDYKNFLRLHIASSGDLTIFPIGVRQMPRKWKRADPVRKDRPQLIPTDRPIDAQLIEDPVEIR